MNPASIPAFPFIDSASPLEHPGMTLRDYFAAKAMQGMMDSVCSDEYIARAAYKMADAMLAARGTP
jgi:hypothetical protein